MDSSELIKLMQERDRLLNALADLESKLDFLHSDLQTTQEDQERALADAPVSACFQG